MTAPPKGPIVGYRCWVAERGRLRCVSEHTYLQRWRRLLAIALGEEEAEDPRTLLVT